MLSDDKIKKIKECISEKCAFDIDDIKPESNLRNDLHADSLDGIELVMSLEDEFNIEIHDSDLTDENVTVQQIYDYIEKITA